MSEHDGHRERLRAHFLEHGMDAMRDYEVLELLLFYALPRRDTEPIARKLLSYFGSLSAVLDAPPQELKTVAGIGDNAALLIRLIAPLSRRYMLSRTEMGVLLRSSKDTGKFIVPYFHGETEESVYLLCLDSKSKMIACRLLQRGSLNSVALPLRKVVEIAINSNAASVILAHNHPGGVALPSAADYQATELVRETLRPLEIDLLDHVVVSEEDYVSMKDNGFLRDT